MLAAPVFRTRFASQWACDPVDPGDGEDDESSIAAWLRARMG
jgi:hypothetical protein